MTRAAKVYTDYKPEIPHAPELMTRAQKWAEFDRIIDISEAAPPAMVQELTVGGLWCIQKLVRSTRSVFSDNYRSNNDPPRDTINHGEAYYDQWPGDHRGWMRFQTRDEAVTFYQFAEHFITFEEYCRRDKKENSQVSFALDETGNIIEQEKAA